MSKFTSAAAIAYFCLAGSLLAQVPGIINYQGRVAVGGTNFDGTGQFKFALVNATGTATNWLSGVNPVNCPVSKGLYSVLLGDPIIPNMTVLPASVFTNSDVRLRVWFNDGVNGLQQLSPDQRIASAGYALMAANSSMLNASDRIQLRGGPSGSAGMWLEGAPGTNTAFVGVFDSTYYGFWGLGSGWDMLINRTNGFTGIGMAPIGAPLTVASESAYAGNVIRTATLSTPDLFNLTLRAASPGANVVTWNFDQVNYGVSYANALVFSSGKIGIGTTVPSTALDVNGTIKATAFLGSGASLTGVNADTVDGIQGAALAQLAADQTFTGTNIFSRRTGFGVTDPGYALEAGDRIRLRSGASGTAGIWLRDPQSNNATFFGLESSVLWGVWGSGCGWGLAMNLTNGNVGIGTTDFLAPLTVSSETAYSGKIFRAETLSQPENYSLTLKAVTIGAGDVSWNFDQVNNGSTYTNALVFRGGMIGIDNATPNCALDVNGGGYFNGYIGVNASFSDVGLTVQRQGDATVAQTAEFRDETGAHQVRIGIGDYSLYVFGKAARSGGNVAWDVPSDRRLKTQIQPLENAMDVIDNVRPVRFHYSPEYRAQAPGTRDIEQFGVVAQDFAKVFTDFVSTNADGFMDVNVSPLVFFNTAAIRELHEQARAKDAEISALQASVAELREAVRKLSATVK